MKIAIVINTSWNIYNFRKGLVQALLHRGDEVVAVAPHDKYTQKLLGWGCAYEPLDIKSSGMNPVEDLVLISQLKNTLRKTKPDIVLTLYYQAQSLWVNCSGFFRYTLHLQRKRLRSHLSLEGNV